MSNYKKLLVWQKAHLMATTAIKMATTIRATHFASLKSQIIRSASSVPANIVEGSGQESRKEFCRFLRYALNSAYELEYHWILAHDIDIVSDADFQAFSERAIEVQKMLHGLIRRLRPPDDDDSEETP